MSLFILGELLQERIKELGIFQHVGSYVDLNSFMEGSKTTPACAIIYNNMAPLDGDHKSTRNAKLHKQYWLLVVAVSSSVNGSTSQYRLKEAGELMHELAKSVYEFRPKTAESNGIIFTSGIKPESNPFTPQLISNMGYFPLGLSININIQSN